MAYEPRLTVYTIKINPVNSDVLKTNRWLFRNLTGNANNQEMSDSFIFLELFRKFISTLDQEQMYREEKTKKSITANQPNIDDESVPPNIVINSDKFIIQGVIEGGGYGKKRKKTSTLNKANKQEVSDSDAITSDYYFLLYTPLEQNKMTLMVQSYTGDSVDDAVKSFFANFFQVVDVFKKPSIRKFTPPSIIEDFKKETAVSSLLFSTEIPGTTLLEDSTIESEKKYRVTISIKPAEGDLSHAEYDNVIAKIFGKEFYNPLRAYKSKRGSLKDLQTNKRSSFNLDTDFEINPVIMLNKYLTLDNNDLDFEAIKEYCENLLETEIKELIYPSNGIQER